MTYRLSARAESDLADIWVYSAEQWGVDQADRYVEALMIRFVWLCENPSLWMPRQDIAEGLYGCPQQSHVIYFKTDGDAPDAIQIVRVLHGRMESANHV